MANRPPYIIKGSPFYLILETAMFLCGIYLIIKDYAPVLGVIFAILGVVLVGLRLIRGRNILTIDAEGIKVKDWIVGEYTIAWQDISCCYYGYYWGIASYGFRSFIPQPIINIATTPQARNKIKRSVIWLGWNEYIYKKYELIEALKYFGGEGRYNEARANKSKRFRKVLAIIGIVLIFALLSLSL